MALNAPYPGVPDAMHELSGSFSLAIATSKDGRSVESLLQAYGLSVLFPPSTILDKSQGESKRTHLSRLREKFGCSFDDMCFIDDKFSHLLDCSPLGVRCFLAGWGYNGEEEQSVAETHGFPVLSVNSLRAVKTIR